MGDEITSGGSLDAESQYGDNDEGFSEIDTSEDTGKQYFDDDSNSSKSFDYLDAAAAPAPRMRFPSKPVIRGRPTRKATAFVNMSPPTKQITSQRGNHYEDTDDASSFTSGASSTFASTVDRSADERQLSEIEIGDDIVTHRPSTIMRLPPTTRQYRMQDGGGDEPFAVAIGDEPSMDGEEGSATDFETVGSDVFDDQQTVESADSEGAPRDNNNHSRYHAGNPVMEEFGPSSIRRTRQSSHPF
eukprot:TRINITY_DN11522_c0_g1_i1.p1 TRINITY_DN11522_c0_g1~~TRINITY_DN11522_c0_g1_i1.p1  ORF type:complete len:253 (+),score=22.73 TRINITY_DN11522_c0_g1_i1:29-760(+)